MGFVVSFFKILEPVTVFIFMNKFVLELSKLCSGNPKSPYCQSIFLRLLSWFFRKFPRRPISSSLFNKGIHILSQDEFLVKLVNESCIDLATRCWSSRRPTLGEGGGLFERPAFGPQMPVGPSSLVNTCHSLFLDKTVLCDGIVLLLLLFLNRCQS